jgi:hypothetical protein
MSSSIELTCPAANDDVVVHMVDGHRTICVTGTYTEKKPFPLLQWLVDLVVAVFRWLLRLFGGRPTTTTLTIRVRIVSGDPSNETPGKQAGDVDITPPTAKWCARAVWLPGTATTGLTVMAWLLATGDVIEDGPQEHTPVSADGSGTVDCCASCGSGLEAAGQRVVGELTAHPRLDVAVPDGPHAGLHTALGVAPLTWAVVADGVTFRVVCCPAGGLTVHGPSGAVTATAVESGPFSATFPGGAFGASGDVVVTKA